MFNGLKTWQKAILITVFSVIGAFMTAWFAVWLDNKINPISKYWDESSSPVDIHALNDRIYRACPRFQAWGQAAE